MDPRPGATVTTRDRVVERALQLFSERGTTGVSMRELADAAGVTVPGLYYHFASKAELVRAVYRERIEREPWEAPDPAPVRAADRRAGQPRVRPLPRRPRLPAAHAPRVGARRPRRARRRGRARRRVARAVAPGTPARHRSRARRRCRGRDRRDHDLLVGVVRRAPPPTANDRSTNASATWRDVAGSRTHRHTARDGDEPDRVRGGALEAPHRPHHRGRDRGHVPRRARQHDRRHRDAHRDRRPQRHRPLRVGLHGLPARRDRVDPALGPPRRHVRPQAHLPARHDHLPRRLGALRRCRRRWGS